MASSIPTPPPLAPFDLAILGAGAAGMIAAVAAGEILAGTGKTIAIFERNPQPGIKVLVCGGGRCNFTNAGTIDFLIEQFGRNGRFLTPALRHLDNDALRNFFTNLGVPSHIEPGGKVYPDSNQARSIVDALVRRMRELHVHIHAGPNSAIQAVALNTSHEPRSTSHDFILTTTDNRTFNTRTVFICVGGMSYQRMGTLGDGYRFAASLGHTIMTPRPAIVGLLTQEAWAKSIPGLAVRDVEVMLPLNRQSAIGNRQSVGDLLFTHFGLSGPAILNPSEIIAELLESHPAITIHIDFARHLTHDQTRAQLRSFQQNHGKKRLKTMLSQNTPDLTINTTSPDQTDVFAPETPSNTGELRIPARLAEQLCALEQIPPDQSCATLTSPQMHRLVQRLKRCPFTITATRGFKEAMVTAGGVKLSEVDPHTLESKIVPNLFLAGEVLDLTGPSGGYNLQLAFSTGHLAGKTIGDRLASLH